MRQICVQTLVSPADLLHHHPQPKVETKPAPAPAKSKGTMPKGFNAESAPKPKEKSLKDVRKKKFMGREYMGVAPDGKIFKVFPKVKPQL